MTSAPSPAPPVPGPNKTDPFFDSIRRVGIWRTDDRWFGGVAAGISHRIGIDPLIVRGLFVLISIFGGLGVLAYGLAWLLLPEASDGRIHLQQALRGDVSAGFIGAVVMTLVGVGRPLWWTHAGWGWLWGFLIVGLVVAAIIALVAVALSRPTRAPGTPVPPPGTPPASVPTPPGGPVPPPGFRVTPLPTPPSGAAPATPAPQGVPMSHPAPSTGWSPTPAATAPYPQPAPTPGSPTPATPTAHTYAAASGTPGVRTAVPVQAAPTGQYPPYQAAPTQYQHKGPGKALVSAVLGLILLAVALVLLFAWGWSNSFALCVGIALVLLGGGIIVAGAMGRSSGTLGFFSIMTLVILVPIGLATTAWNGFDWGSQGPRTFWTDSTFAPATAADAAWGVSSATGDAYVDLTGLDLGEETSATLVPIDLGAGQVEVAVPRNMAIRVEASVGAGEINLKTQEAWNTSWERTGRGPWGSGPNRTVSGSYTEEALGGPGVSLGATSPLWQSDDQPGIVLQIHSGAGQIIIEEK